MSDGAGKYERLMKAAVENVSQSFFDEYERSNAEFRTKAGLHMLVIREEVGDCCDWCADLAGTYDYENAPKEVWQRHAHCRCMVITRTEKGTYQDAWSRKEYETRREARIAREEEIIKENENSKKAIINRKEYSAAAGTLPPKMKQYVPNLEERLKIIEEGIHEPKPIFCEKEKLLYKLEEKLPEAQNIYTVVLDGDAYYVEFKGKPIDPDTLCAIIAQRADYKKGTDIRLISCYTGQESDGVAQYIADKLKVNVIAPDKKGIISRSIGGEYNVYSGSDIGIHDGEMRVFSPKEKND